MAAKVLCILETMWGTAGKAERWFRINPANFSGSPQQVGSAREHGKPDPDWLRSNLNDLPTEWKRLPLVVCGKVAQETYHKSGYEHLGPVMEIPHPANRTYWTAENTQHSLHGQNYDLRRCAKLCHYHSGAAMGKPTVMEGAGRWQVT